MTRAITKGLIVDEPWISAILHGSKTWEMRKTATKLRGTIALIRKGSGHIVGTAELVGSLPPLNAADYARHENMLGIPATRQEKARLDGWSHPWVLQNARRLSRPIPYRHPNGAVIWVNLEASVTQALGSQT